MIWGLMVFVFSLSHSPKNTHTINQSINNKVKKEGKKSGTKKTHTHTKKTVKFKKHRDDATQMRLSRATRNAIGSRIGKMKYSRHHN